MLRYSLNLDAAAGRIENAVESVLNQGIRTGDIADDKAAAVGTVEMTKHIIKELKK
jgi:3-isopropylmalate dehydrogenase